MSESIDINKIYNELVELRKDVDYIKRNMIDPDIIMTLEESKKLDFAMEEQKAKKTTKLSDLKKELGI
ncbi:MAG: hypothetical protein V1859_10690 [archaeon]